MAIVTVGGLVAAGLLLAACNGKTLDAARTTEPPGDGGVTSDASAGGSPGAGGASPGGGASASGGALGASGGAPAAGAADSGTTRCDFSHTTCGGETSYIEIGVGDSAFRLAYPADPGCGVCGVDGCEIWSFAKSVCGKTSLETAACAGPLGAPPCLDTSSLSSSYVDATGLRFGGASLSTHDVVPEPNAAGILDFDATLSLRTADGGVIEIPAHVHVCGDVRRLFPPC
ncbi:MAG TPA: hypothetical protein VHE30_14935 [Polyangiaceae bacterium]|nr:hypothetical protein [Polyangiaceae bacterium]